MKADEDVTFLTDTVNPRESDIVLQQEWAFQNPAVDVCTQPSPVPMAASHTMGPYFLELRAQRSGTKRGCFGQLVPKRQMRERGWRYCPLTDPSLISGISHSSPQAEGGRNITSVTSLSVERNIRTW